ncbi:MAG TPA: TetR/AcrR family transcriptional regulator [Acidimicrobiales bacterium]|nr:TetR/AcrR family transcriptional regulator [Acidimicrobiales bacterium]
MTATRSDPDRSAARPAPVGRARRGEGDRTREAILEAADRLLVESGSEEAVSVRAVADAVGLTPPTIYRHFDDKDHLLFEVCAVHFDRLDREVVAPVVAAVADPVEALRQIAHDYVRFGLDDPEHYRIMFMGHAAHTPERYDDHQILSTGCFGSVIELVSRAVDEGRLRAGEGGPVVLAFVLWSALHGLVATRVAKPNMPGPPADLLVEAILEAFLHGVATEPA